MKIEDVKKEIVEILDEFGIYISQRETEEDMDLRDYIVDSVQFIYFIVELEERLQICIPDEMLVFDNMSSLLGFSNMIAELSVELGC